MKKPTGFGTPTIAGLLLSAGAIMILSGTVASAGADGVASRTRPGFLRDNVERPAGKNPPLALMPDALRLDIGAVSQPVQLPGPAGQAISEADRMARELSRTNGRREYYRVGFHQGLRSAVADESLGMWDYIQGSRLGERDPEARSLGNGAGMREADEAARENARLLVEAEFMDLSREPSRHPPLSTPRHDPPSVWIAPPELSEIFNDIRSDGVPGLGRRAAEEFDGWRYDPWELYRCASYDDFYEGRWRESGNAFARFLSSSRGARLYRRLSGEVARREFERVFRNEFDRRLPLYFNDHLLPAHRRGFEDGWTLGAAVRYEYSFRLGYSEGFDRAATAASRVGFRKAYSGFLDRHWTREFNNWSNSVVPGILNVVVIDADDDGVLRPGETALVEYELANYGGGSGTLALRLEGRYLDRSVERVVGFRGRGTQRSREPFRAGILATTPPRTRATLTMRIGESAEKVHAFVSNPLEFSGRVTLDRIDALGGTAVLIVRAVNTSRVPVDASIDLAALSGYETTRTAALGTLEPGQAGAASFEISGVTPLDMLSGDLVASLVVRDRGDVQDRLEFGFPDLACDLDNRDLMLLLAAMSGDAGTPASDIARARALLLRRMRADWRIAVRGRGNPYRYDLKHGTAGTSLGDLARVYRKARAAAVRPEVFDGLGQEITILADELPGTHPFLRKSMKKLARRIG